MHDDEISRRQAEYYGGLLAEHGPGVDAVASARQAYKDLRYDRLCRVFLDDPSETVSVHDVGFGLAHFREHLIARHPGRRFDYSGSEVTPEFVEQCKRDLPDCTFLLRDLSIAPGEDRYDYLIFGGTFYHHRGIAQDPFQTWMERLLSNAFVMAQRGIAFNLITDHVQYRKEDLFYADRHRVLDFCLTELSRHVNVDHATPLFEYTVCVWTPDWIASQHPDPAFDRYVGRPPSGPQRP